MPEGLGLQYSVKLEGGEAFRARLDWVHAMMPDVIHAALEESAFLVEGRAGQNVYNVFTARTGNLATGIHSEVEGAEYARVGPTVEYGRLRELGGVVDRAWGHVTAVHVGRPYLSPALDASRDDINQIFRTRIDTVLDGGK